MECETILLDTPKKASLQQQSTDLRSILKEFERTFTAENGRKPKQADIKTDNVIAEKYKEYHKIQDVLGGKLSFEKYNSVGFSTRVKTRRHTRVDSGVGSSPQKQNAIEFATPRKQKRSHEQLSFESELKSPNVYLVNAIGPTPHRDGKVLGLFDLMPASGSNKGINNTPTSSARKRQIEELYQDTPAKRPALQTIQTPGQRSSKRPGDLLDFLTWTPQKSLEPSNTRHSRTPQSEGRKFELSQFFATPSTQRFLFSNRDSTKKTQILKTVPELDTTPQRQPNTARLDATPSYLRRSTSFKDRLLSASQGPVNSDSVPPLKPVGPPTLRYFRSSTSGIFRVKDSQQSRPIHETDDNDDDLEALRELENEDYEYETVIKDSQLDLAPAASPEPDEDQAPVKEYKKKGQKRTTRKANIKPVAQKPTTQPKFVAADDYGSEEDFESANDDFDMSESRKKGTDSKTKRKAGTINPNAQSHQNFRSLKIKNKNSKAKGASKGRFSRARRQ